jgi:hypothetical protein
MACNLSRPRPQKMTLAEAKLLFHGLDPSQPDADEAREALKFLPRRSTWNKEDAAKEEARCRAIEDVRNAELVDDGNGEAMFICGRDLDVAPCRGPECVYDGEFLCDFPMGRGKTCDLPLCGDHAREVGPELHLCPLHFPMWIEKARTDRVNPWPPPRR